MAATIYLVRHGQASFGAADYDHLSPLGQEQGAAVGELLRRRGVHLDHVVCGSLRRHRQTAAACLAAFAGLSDGATAEPVIDEGWNEFDHVELLTRFEPRYVDQAAIAADLAKASKLGTALREIFGKAVERWTGGAFDAEYRETWTQFGARCRGALERVVAATPPNGNAVVFSSGGVIGTVAGTLLGLDPRAAFALQWNIVNASITRLRTGSRGAFVVTLNEHQHLEHQSRLVTSR